MDSDVESYSSIRGRREWRDWELPQEPLYTPADRASSAYNLFRTCRPARPHHQENLSAWADQGIPGLRRALSGAAWRQTAVGRRESRPGPYDLRPGGNTRPVEHST